jgi:hypothetical protein
MTYNIVYVLVRRRHGDHDRPVLFPLQKAGNHDFETCFICDRLFGRISRPIKSPLHTGANETVGMACTSASRDDRQKLRVTVVGIEDERAVGCNFDGRLPYSSVSNANLRRGRCFDIEIYLDFR